MEAQRVQALLENGIKSVPKDYIQPPELRPTPTKPTPKNATAEIPVIDMSEACPHDTERIREEVGDACKEWGVFQIINHGVPPSLLNEMKNNGSEFFNSPLDHKLKFSCKPGSAASEGYGSQMLVKDDHVLDWRDYFDHHTLPLSRRNPLNWPTNPPSYRDTVKVYSHQMELLAQRLLAVMSEALGLPVDYLQKAIGQPYQNITISFYPACPQPELTLGLQAHSDMGAVTLLIQDDVGGLQVYKEEQWITVQPIPDAIVVNLGDQSQILTNGIYKSIVHRAIVNARRARLSVATFYDPSQETKICPASELVTKDSPRRYREVLYADYVSDWYTKGPDGKRNIDMLEINC